MILTWAIYVVPLVAQLLPLAPAPPAISLSITERQLIGTLSPLPDPPPDPTNAVADNPAAAVLGEALFFDRRVSGNGQHACASCHVPAQAFTDGHRVAEATSGSGQLTRNTPSLLNVAWQQWLYWDGRADSLWAQALKPIEHPDELGSSRQHIVALIKEDTELSAAYGAVFGWPSSPDAGPESVDRVFANVGKALAAFQRTLQSGPTPFDRFFAALKNAGSIPNDFGPSAQRGLKLFIGRARCVLCHSGPTFSDGLFHDTAVEALGADSGRLGGINHVINDPFNAAGNFSDDPAGRQARRIGQLQPLGHQQGQFKTPALRNVALTAPYMHAGQFDTLAQVVEHYSSAHGATLHDHGVPGLLVPLNLTSEEKSDLVSFLHSLTSDPQDARLQHVLEPKAQ